MGFCLLCSVGAGMMGVSALGNIAGAVMGGQSDAADYNKKMDALNHEADAINKSTIFKYQQQSLAEQEIQDKTSIDIDNLKTSARAAEGTATAAAATGGVEGNSVEALRNGFLVATGKDIGVAKLSERNQIGQLEQEKHGTTMDAANRKQALRDQIPENPSGKIMGRYLGAALGIGGDYMKFTTKTDDGSGFLGRKFG